MKFIECLREWNGGISRGARAKLAKVLKVTETTVMRWAKGELPSEEKMRDIAKILNKSEKEVREMFVADNSVNQQGNGNSGNVITGNNNSQNVNTALPGVAETEVKEIAGEIKQMKKDIQILNLKMDLMLEKMKDK